MVLVIMTTKIVLNCSDLELVQMYFFHVSVMDG